MRDSSAPLGDRFNAHDPGALTPVALARNVSRSLAFSLDPASRTMTQRTGLLVKDVIGRVIDTLLCADCRTRAGRRDSAGGVDSLDKTHAGQCARC